ncbi:hypothetical protein [Natrinema salaciae]|uniref:Uncharacterized protein n=1 Tax=Natrinema salaciae TaxID=1186196 RepID=A0A1H9IB34_9EURY|nr:hypothetical protein [Natrinema salaciae]SEQ71742.1 hypothetical protein SAMN04489841_2169 [Natrinema salaciae]
MPVTALLGTKSTRSLTVRSVWAAAKREFDRGNRARGLLLLSLLLLVRSGAVVEALRRGRRPSD